MPRKHRRDAKTSLVVRKPEALQKSSRIVLDDSDTAQLFARELRAVELTGHVHHARAEKSCNIVESALHDVVAESVEFLGCDWKDSAVRSCRFVRSTFGSSSLAYDTFIKTTFDNCVFDDTDIQNCEFDEVVFIGCDFRYLLIKTCTFSRCEFIRCQTNNKLFETCRFVETTFRSTELEIQTIAENFGITASAYEGVLRDDRIDLSTRKLSIPELRKWLSRSNAHPLHRINVEYFLKETLLEGSVHLDACFRFEAWLPMFRTANSFVVVLNQWVDFLLWLCERNQISMHTILAVHTMTGELLNAIHSRAEHSSRLAAISGAHLSLARAVDRYLDLVDQSARRYPNGVQLLVEGGTSKRFYEKALQALLVHTDARITAVVPHNSPWDLSIAFGSASGSMLFMAFLLATRTHIELSRIRTHVQQTQKVGKKGKSVTSKSTKVADPILAVDFGRALPQSTSPNFRLRAYLPGNLLAELKITVSSRRVGRLRRVIRDLL